MSLKHTYILYDLDDVEITPEGGSLTDIYGIRSLNLTFNFASTDAVGDAMVLGTFSKVSTISFSAEQAALDLNSMAALFGQSVTDAGTTPSQTATLEIDSSSLPYFKIESKTAKLENKGSGTEDVADVHVTLYKCKINDFSLDQVIDDVWVVSFSGIAIPDSSNSNKIIKIVANETAADIS